MYMCFTKQIQKTKSRKGFTLIELIVVIAIIGILAVIVVPKFAGFTNKAKVAADQATATTILKAAQISEAEDPSLDRTTDELVTAGLIEDPGNAQTTGHAFVVNYDATSGEPSSVTYN